MILAFCLETVADLSFKKSDTRKTWWYPSIERNKISFSGCRQMGFIGNNSEEQLYKEIALNFCLEFCLNSVLSIKLLPYPMCRIKPSFFCSSSFSCSLSSSFSAVLFHVHCPQVLSAVLLFHIHCPSVVQIDPYWWELEP